MALNRFNDILERTKRHSEERKADRDLKKKGIDKMNPDSWWADDSGEEKIDVPEFDASVQDLPENDEYEKEIKVVPQEPKGTSFNVPSGQKDNYSLEQLAGNGMPEEEIPEPKEPKGTSINIPREENPEWDLEDLAGNGQRETPKADPMVEDVDDDLSIVDELHKDDPVGEVDEEGNLLPPKEEEPAEEGSVEEPEFDESDVADPEDNPDIPTDEEIENAESGEEETTEENTDEKDTNEEESEEESEEEPKEKTRTEQGPINDDSDLIKKGSGVSVSDMVDRSQIPHYDYLSFFR
jgi:hypothetical protein